MITPVKYYNLAKNEKSNTLYIFGDITSFDWRESDVSSYSLVSELGELDPSMPLTVCINSYGGEFAEGLAIYNALRRFGNVTTVVDGFAASVASVIFMAGNKRIMNRCSLLFIHSVISGTHGDANKHRKAADELEKMTETAMNAYLEYVNIGEERLKQLLDAETWLDATEAKNMNFATEIMTEVNGDHPSQSAREAFKLLHERAKTSHSSAGSESTFSKFLGTLSRKG